MSEIERAIEYYKENEFYMQKYNADLGTMKMNELALTALKEKLEREKNPLTCEGCKWEFNRSLGSADMCYNCNRMRKKDRYEPKGEQPCLK
jgi:hypothetical protein